MHMADALVSPAVGGVMWAASAGVGAYCAAKVRPQIDEGKLPLMGVAGAFVFAAQMINFTIPGTGSSGHIGGGMLLAALLGPHAAFLAIASVLVIQAFFFADGGLLALGCNVFNMGFFPAFVAWPLVYRALAGGTPGRGRLTASAVLGAVVSLQLGASAVVLETLASGISQLPFGAFVLLMQPIHLAIGVVEGLATAAVLLYVREARPEVLAAAVKGGGLAGVPVRKVLIVLAGLAVATGAALSWFASTHPDGLEWAMGKTAGVEELPAPATGIHRVLATLQEKLAFLPDYSFRSGGEEAKTAEAPSWPAPSAGTSVAGLVGAACTLVLVVLVALLLRRRQTRGSP